LTLIAAISRLVGKMPFGEIQQAALLCGLEVGEYNVSEFCIARARANLEIIHHYRRIEGVTKILLRRT
jgi:hypothetical protein